MKKWILSAVAYLALVVGVYYILEAFSDAPQNEEQHTDLEQHS